jgi:hypothetical protein
MLKVIQIVFIKNTFYTAGCVGKGVWAGSFPNPDCSALYVNLSEGSEALGAAVRKAELDCVDYTKTPFSKGDRSLNDVFERMNSYERIYAMANFTGIKKNMLHKFSRRITIWIKEEKIIFRFTSRSDQEKFGGKFIEQDVEKEPWLPNKASNEEIGQVLIDWVESLQSENTTSKN